MKIYQGGPTWNDHAPPDTIPVQMLLSSISGEETRHLGPYYLATQTRQKPGWRWCDWVRFTEMICHAQGR